jgi:hypothetical protein
MQQRAEQSALQPRSAEPLRRSAETPFVAPTPLFQASNRETDETYGGVVAVLNGKLRVIAGSCGLQWVIQKRKNPLIWSSFAFCGTKEGLILRIRGQLQAQSGESRTLSLEALVKRYCDPEAWAKITALPPCHPPVGSEIRDEAEAGATPVASAAF